MAYPDLEQLSGTCALLFSGLPMSTLRTSSGGAVATQAFLPVLGLLEMTPSLLEVNVEAEAEAKAEEGVEAEAEAGAKGEAEVEGVDVGRVLRHPNPRRAERRLVLLKPASELPPGGETSLQ